eukprot:6375212-Amphidinium_carterae.1
MTSQKLPSPTEFFHTHFSTTVADFGDRPSNKMVLVQYVWTMQTVFGKVHKMYDNLDLKIVQS